MEINFDSRIWTKIGEIAGPCFKAGIIGVALLVVIIPIVHFAQESKADQIGDIQTNAGYIHDFTPPVVYECSIHGILDRNPKTGTTVECTLNDEEIGVWCFECMADFFNKNLPQIEIVNPNE